MRILVLCLLMLTSHARAAPKPLSPNLTPDRFEAAKYFKGEVREWIRSVEQLRRHERGLVELRARILRLQAADEAPIVQQHIDDMLTNDLKKLALAEFQADRARHRVRAQPTLRVFEPGLRCKDDTDCTAMAMQCCGGEPIPCNTGYGTMVQPGIDLLHQTLSCDPTCGIPPTSECESGHCALP